MSAPCTAARERAPCVLHLRAIYQQTAPRLLRLITARVRDPWCTGTGARYRPADRTVAPGRLDGMLATLDNLRSTCHTTHAAQTADLDWVGAVAAAWLEVCEGTSAATAAAQLWPHYLGRVRDWLTRAQHASTEQRAAQLAGAHEDMFNAINAITDIAEDADVVPRRSPA